MLPSLPLVVSFLIFTGNIIIIVIIMMMMMITMMIMMMMIIMMIIIIIIIIIIIGGKHITAKMTNHWPSTNTKLMYNYFVFEGLFVNVYHHLSQMKLSFFTCVILSDLFSSGFYKNDQGVFKRYSPNFPLFSSEGFLLRCTSCKNLSAEKLFSQSLIICFAVR